MATHAVTDARRIQMATVKSADKVKSTASSEAIELFGCFHSGIDDFVYQVAEDVAREREMSEGKQNQGPVQIEKGDVKKAAETVFAALREMVQNGRLPQDAAQSIDSMEACLSLHCS